MRTTVRIHESLLNEAKRTAAERGTTLTALIEDGLRQVLAARQGHPHQPVRLPIVKGEGLQPGVDLDDSADLLDRMESRSGSA